MVASDNIALFVHTQATVSITIVSKTNIQTILNHKLLQALNVSGTCIIVDVQTIRLVVNNIGVCTQSIEHRLCDVPTCTVSTIQTNLDPLERVNTQGN